MKLSEAVQKDLSEIKALEVNINRLGCIKFSNTMQPSIARSSGELDSTSLYTECAFIKEIYKDGAVFMNAVFDGWKAQATEKLQARLDELEKQHAVRY